MAEFKTGFVGGPLQELGQRALSVWGGGMPTDPSNPEKIERRRKMTDVLAKNAMDTSPVPGTGGWDSLSQGMSRVVSGLAYGRRNFVSDEQERLGQEAAASAFNTAREGGLTREELADLVANQPFLNDRQLKGAELLLPPDPTKIGKGDRLVNPQTGEQIYPKPGADAPVDVDVEDQIKFINNFEAAAGVKEYFTSVPILESMAKSFGDKSVISDLDYVYGLPRILDPQSVVREGEAATIAKSQSLPAELKGKLLKILAGEQQLDDVTRRDIYNLASRRVAGHYALAKRAYDFTILQGRHHNIPPDYFPTLPDLPGPIPAYTEVD